MIKENVQLVQLNDAYEIDTQVEMTDESRQQKIKVLGLKIDISKFVFQAGGKGDQEKGTGRVNRDRTRT